MDGIVAVDVGGTEMKGALFDERLRVRASERRHTPAADGPQAVIEAAAHLLGELVARASGAALRSVACGVVVPGIVDEDRGVAVLSANLQWRDVPLRGLLEARLGLPVTLGHDVRAGGLAEAESGAGRDASSLLFVPVGTGVAAATVIGGRPLTGGGYAGEIGHLRAVADGARCGCGGRGCLETVASARAVAAAYTARTGRAVDGALDVAARLDADPDARAVWGDAVAHLADALAGAVATVAPEVIVVGGGLARAGDALLCPLRRQLADRLPLQPLPRLVPAQLGDGAGCFGAALLARRMSGTGEQRC